MAEVVETKQSHQATIGYNEEQLKLSCRVHALQEAVHLIVGTPLVQLVSQAKESPRITPTVLDLANMTVKAAKRFEEYLEKGE